jgi:hypothetical protein
MRILWPNVFALIFAGIGSLVALRHRAAIGTFLGSIAHIGLGHSDDERTLGLIAFGICAVLFLAVLRILTNNRGH